MEVEEEVVIDHILQQKMGKMVKTIILREDIKLLRDKEMTQQERM